MHLFPCRSQCTAPLLEPIKLHIPNLKLIQKLSVNEYLLNTEVHTQRGAQHSCEESVAVTPVLTSPNMVSVRLNETMYILNDKLYISGLQTYQLGSAIGAESGAASAEPGGATAELTGQCISIQYRRTCLVWSSAYRRSCCGAYPSMYFYSLQKYVPRAGSVRVARRSAEFLLGLLVDT